MLRAAAAGTRGTVLAHVPSIVSAQSLRTGSRLFLQVDRELEVLRRRCVRVETTVSIAAGHAFECFDNMRRAVVTSCQARNGAASVPSNSSEEAFAGLHHLHDHVFELHRHLLRTDAALSILRVVLSFRALPSVVIVFDIGIVNSDYEQTGRKHLFPVTALGLLRSYRWRHGDVVPDIPSNAVQFRSVTSLPHCDPITGASKSAVPDLCKTARISHKEEGRLIYKQLPCLVLLR